MIDAKKSEIYLLLTQMHDELGDRIDPILERRYNSIINNFDEVIRNEVDQLARDTVNSRYSTDTDIDMNVTIMPKE
jgi:hypothetical protein